MGVRGTVGRASGRERLGNSAVGVGGSNTGGELCLDEAELADLVAGVQPVTAGAALWLREPVALLPGPQRRRRDVKHPRTGTNAVQRAAAHGRPVTSWSPWHPLTILTLQYLFKDVGTTQIRCIPEE